MIYNKFAIPLTVTNYKKTIWVFGDGIYMYI